MKHKNNAKFYCMAYYVQLFYKFCNILAFTHCLTSKNVMTSKTTLTRTSIKTIKYGSVYIPFFSFFVFKFANEKRITNSFFVFRFQICERKTNSFFVFKSDVRKTNSFFVFAFRMLRSHCHFGWPVKIGNFGGILQSHWQRFENKLAEIASAKWYI